MEHNINNEYKYDESKIFTKKSISLIKDYINENDWRVNENSNTNYSLSGLNNYIVNSLSALYWLYEIYDEEIRGAHKTADIHIHDLGLISAYCTGWDMSDLLLEGFNGVSGKISAGPPKHFSTALGQCWNFMYTIANEIAGAIAMNNFDTYLAPFIRFDKLSYKQVKQHLQEYIYNMNVPSRNGMQSPFSNITLDLTVPNHMKDKPVIYGGKYLDITYGDFQKEMDIFNQAFYEIMLEGDYKGRIFSFPIPTVNITSDFDWDNPRYNKMWEATSRFGVNYFANYIHTDMNPEDALSMCPLGKNEKIMYIDDDKKINVAAISDLYDMYKNREFMAYSNGEFVKVRINAFENKRLLKIYLSNGDYIIMSDDHQNVAKLKRDDVIKMSVPAYQLDEHCYLPFSLRVADFILDMEEKDLYVIFELIGALYINGFYDHDEDVFIINIDSISHEDFKNVELYINSINGKTILPNIEFEWDDGFGEIRISGKKFKKYVNNYCDIDEYGDIYINYNILHNDYYSLLSFLHGMSIPSYPDNKIYVDKKKLNIVKMIHYLLGKVPYIKLDTDINMYVVNDIEMNTNNIYYYHKDSYFHWVKIEKIIPAYDIDDAYCLEVVDQDTPPIFTVATSGIITHNCRLRLDLRELHNKGGGLFGAGSKTGSIGVVTLNMPRLGYLNKGKSKDELFNEIKRKMDIAKRSLLIKRKVIEEYTEKGLYPYVKRYLKDTYDRFGSYWANHFNTIGIIGMNEMTLNYMGKPIMDPDAKKLVMDIMDFMRDIIADYQEETKLHFNLEATPGESLSYRFAKHDKKRYPDIITAGTNESPYYTNSVHLPVNYTDNIFELLEHQNDLQPKFTGGTVIHIFLGEKIDDPNAAKLLIKKITHNYSIPYISITPTFSICPEHGYIPGNHKYCPICMEEIDSEGGDCLCG